MKYKILILFVLILISCQKTNLTEFITECKNCQTYSTVVGKHDFVPSELLTIRINPEHLVYKFKYANNFQYYYDNLEWRDWLKGGGLSFNLTSNFNDAVMWVFRYNYITNKIEHSAYLYINGNLVKGYINPTQYNELKIKNNSSRNWWGNDEVFLELGHEEYGICDIKIDYSNHKYILTFYSESDPFNKKQVFYPFFHDNFATRDIGIYFGGTIKPYDEMQLTKCQIELK